jgi:thiosulfate/3-mercaptopyruvate sulfurtransferase
MTRLPSLVLATVLAAAVAAGGWVAVQPAAAATPASSSAVTPLVSVDWLKSNLGKAGIVILDVRSGGGVPKAGYLAGHIPGAVFTDYAKAGWREKNAAGVGGMLPSPSKLEGVIGAHGIDNGSHVVLVPEGRTAADMGAATRLYWTFKVLGHDAVSILDGGFQAWIRPVDKDKKPINPLETMEVKPAQKKFTAKVRSEMIIGTADVEKARAAGQPLVDNRPLDFFMGLTKSPAAKTGGTIPGAMSVPEGWLTENGGGTFRSKSQLAKIYEIQKVPTSGAQINFCNTGHWASLGWFVASELLGNQEAKMYDGSMAEWTQDAKRPVDRKVKLD